MATVRNDSATVNTPINGRQQAAFPQLAGGPQAAGQPATLPLRSPAEVEAVTWVALGKIASKQEGGEGEHLQRDQLPDGAAYGLHLWLVGQVDGQPINLPITGRVTVGHGGQKASSSTNAVDVLARVLGKVNAQTRAAILRDLPAEYGPNGKLETVADERREEAETLLKACRQTVKVPARGPVKVQYQVGFKT